MKKANIQSDYSDSQLSLIQTDDCDTVIKIRGNGEFRIATNGGRFHGDKLVAITTKFSELIDIINN